MASDSHAHEEEFCGLGFVIKGYKLQKNCMCLLCTECPGHSGSEFPFSSSSPPIEQRWPQKVVTFKATASTFPMDLYGSSKGSWSWLKYLKRYRLHGLVISIKCLQEELSNSKEEKCLEQAGAGLGSFSVYQYIRVQK